QYNEMVTAAAQLVAAANGGVAVTGSTSNSRAAREQHRDELTFATDRLLGWAQVFDELDALRRI
ncbi:MAG TPA: hypothetical protein VF299_04630, partial [Mycobacterium sp.]